MRGRECWNGGVMEKKNKNRGYQKLRVWQVSIEYYLLVCKIYRQLPYELRRVVSPAIASADSVHRNIAEVTAAAALRSICIFKY